MTKTYNALVLAGGEARRMGGVDKAEVEIGRRTLLERVVAATSGAALTVCVGPERATSRPVIWTREHPPGGGPVPALAAGMLHVTARTVVVLGVDTPFVTREVIEALVEARGTADAAFVRDERGAVQPLIGAYDAEVLISRLVYLDALEGASMNEVLEGLSYRVLDAPGVAFDCDTWEDVERAKRSEEVRDGRLVAAHRGRARRRASGRR